MSSGEAGQEQGSNLEASTLQLPTGPRILPGSEGGGSLNRRE